MKTIKQIISQKSLKVPITMLTAYDYPMASFVDEAGIDMILVGDSLANVVLGLESTTEVGMKEMLHHTKAVVRAVKNTIVVGDMPFESYQVNESVALDNARQFIDAGCQAVKLEWFDRLPAGGLNYSQSRHRRHGPRRTDPANCAKIRRHEGAGQG
jgi:3-methyl-2-oxobutanoate hydroxymethyltransferase